MIGGLTSGAWYFGIRVGSKDPPGMAARVRRNLIFDESSIPVIAAVLSFKKPLLLIIVIASLLFELAMNTAKLDLNR